MPFFPVELESIPLPLSLCFSTKPYTKFAKH
jgi:hypothetical protein